MWIWSTHATLLFIFYHKLVEIETSKETAKFSVNGDIGNGSITLKHNEGEKEGEKVLLNVD